MWGPHLNRSLRIAHGLPMGGHRALGIPLLQAPCSKTPFLGASGAARGKRMRGRDEPEIPAFCLPLPCVTAGAGTLLFLAASGVPLPPNGSLQHPPLPIPPSTGICH